MCDGVCSRALRICANLLTNARQVGWVDELKLREEVRLLGRVKRFPPTFKLAWPTRSGGERRAGLPGAPVKHVPLPGLFVCAPELPFKIYHFPIVHLPAGVFTVSQATQALVLN